MFARRLRLAIAGPGGARPCPQAWLDRFFMRHFTGLRALDDTLPLGDGLLEIGSDVDAGALHAEFEKWLRGHKLLRAEESLQVDA